MRGVDLLALEELMATLSDWLAICQRRVPVVYMSHSIRACKKRIWGVEGTYLKAGGEHASCNDQIGENE